MSPTLAAYTERYHEYFHLLFGFFALLCASAITHLPPITLLLPCLIGTVLPDLDHLISIFIYSRSSRYSATLRHHFVNLQVTQYIDHLRQYHKDNFAVVSHNLASPLVCTFLGSLVIYSHPWLLALLLASAYHFLFDIIEDLLHFRHLNPNWYFRFNFPQD